MSQGPSRIRLANLFRCSKAGVSCVGFSRLIRLPKRHERDKNFATSGFANSIHWFFETAASQPQQAENLW